MSYVVNKNSGLVFGNGGTTENLEQDGYIATLCTSCTKKGNIDGKTFFIDLHMTKDHLIALRQSVQGAIESSE